MKIELSKLIPDPNQPRRVFTEAGLRELGKSLKNVQRDKLLVINHQVTGLPVKLEKGQYLIIDGERRWRAALMVGMTHLDAAVLRMSYSAAYAHAFEVHESREEHSPLARIRGAMRIYLHALKSLKDFPTDAEDEYTAVVRLLRNIRNTKHEAREKVFQDRSFLKYNAADGWQLPKALCDAQAQSGITINTLIHQYPRVAMIDTDTEAAIIDDRLKFSSALELMRIKDPPLRKQVVDYVIRCGMAYKDVFELTNIVNDMNGGDKLIQEFLANDAPNVAALARAHFIAKDNPEPLKARVTDEEITPKHAQELIAFVEENEQIQKYTEPIYNGLWSLARAKQALEDINRPKPERPYKDEIRDLSEALTRANGRLASAIPVYAAAKGNWAYLDEHIVPGFVTLVARYVQMGRDIHKELTGENPEAEALPPYFEEIPLQEETTDDREEDVAENR